MSERKRLVVLYTQVRIAYAILIIAQEEARDIGFGTALGMAVDRTREAAEMIDKATREAGGDG